MADFLFAAALAWMTPLLAALSSSRAASRISVFAFSASPVAAASRNLRSEVLSDERTALLRWRALSFVLIRFIWDLMFATERQPRSSLDGQRRGAGQTTARARCAGGDATSAQLRRPNRARPKRGDLR